MFSCKVPVEQLVLSNTILPLVFVVQNIFVLTKHWQKMVSARWKGKTVHSCTVSKFHCTASKSLHKSHVCFCTASSQNSLSCIYLPCQWSLSTRVCFVLCPRKCNGASLCSSCFSVASTTTSVLVALKVWLSQLTFRQRGKDDGNSTGSSLYKGEWLQMLWSCCIHLPAFQGGDFSVCWATAVQYST